MLFDSSIRRELTRTFSATLFVLLIIVLTMMLIKSLSIANSGMVNPSEVLLVMGFMSLAYFPTILSLSLFIAIVSTLSRMYKDSEMDVWFSSSQGLLRFLKPILQFALPVAAVIALLSMVGWPWANAQSEILVKRYQSRGDIERIAPGQFQESQDGRRVFYINSNTANQAANSAVTEANRLFVFSREDNREVVISAERGRVETQGNNRVAIVQNGQSTEIHDDHSLIVSNFAEYGVRIGTKPTESQTLDPNSPDSLARIKPRSVSTWNLFAIKEPRFQGELGWRIGMFLSAFNFVLLALASTRVNPRSGRSGSLIVALLLFTAYFNLLNFGKNWVGSGKISMPLMLLLVHGSVFVLCSLWLYKRHMQWSFKSLFLPRRGAA